MASKPHQLVYFLNYWWYPSFLRFPVCVARSANLVLRHNDWLAIASFCLHRLRQDLWLRGISLPNNQIPYWMNLMQKKPWISDCTLKRTRIVLREINLNKMRSIPSFCVNLHNQTSNDSCFFALFCILTPRNINICSWDGRLINYK